MTASHVLRLLTEQTKAEKTSRTAGRCHRAIGISIVNTAKGQLSSFSLNGAESTCEQIDRWTDGEEPQKDTEAAPLLAWLNYVVLITCHISSTFRRPTSLKSGHVRRKRFRQTSPHERKSGGIMQGAFRCVSLVVGWDTPDLNGGMNQASALWASLSRMPSPTAWRGDPAVQPDLSAPADRCLLGRKQSLT